MTKGYKTTEFWALTVTSIVGILNQSGAFGDTVLPAGELGILAGTVAAYIISRGLAKINS